MHRASSGTRLCDRRLSDRRRRVAAASAPERLSGEELLAAATTRSGCSGAGQAADWLHAYRDRGDTLNHRYWSLLADSSVPSNPAAAAAALERAIDLHPEADDYVRLAASRTIPSGRCTGWNVPPRSIPTTAALRRSWDTPTRVPRHQLPRCGVRARRGAGSGQHERADRDWDIAYWRTGRLRRRGARAGARLACRSRRQPVARQLVYVHQRLKHNGRRVRTPSGCWTASSTVRADSRGDAAAAADRRFGFQRLHEDLGRRVTINLDGLSGTRRRHRHERIAGRKPLPQLLASRSGCPAGQSTGPRRLDVVRVRTGIRRRRRAVAARCPRKMPMLGVGLRWKPWRSQVIYLAAEHQNGLRRSQPSRRAAASERVVSERRARQRRLASVRRRLVVPEPLPRCRALSGNRLQRVHRRLPHQLSP